MAMNIFQASNQLPRSHTWRLSFPLRFPTGSEKGSSMGERSLSKWAYLPFLILFTSRLEGVRDHGGEGSVQGAAVPRLRVMVPLVPLGLRLPLLPPCVRVAGLGRRTSEAAGAVQAAGSGAASG